MARGTVRQLFTLAALAGTSALAATATGTSPPTPAPTLLRTQSLLAGAQAGDLFGSNVAGVGDVDGDGFDDVAVASLGAVRLDLFRGGPGGVASVPSTTLQGWPSAGEVQVAPAGDLDGDGHGDVAVTAGDLYVHLGSPAGLSTTAHRVFADGMPLGDVNGDGYDDFLGVEDDVWNVYAGGPAGLAAVPLVALEVPSHGYLRVGDLDADGFDDLLRVRREQSFPTNWSEFVELLHGGADGPIGEPEVLSELLGSAEGPSTEFVDFGAIGDVEGQGYAAYWIRTHWEGFRFASSSFWVRSGSADGLVSLDPAPRSGYPDLDPGEPGTLLGDVAGAGDVDADGRADLLVLTVDVPDVCGTVHVYTAGCLPRPAPAGDTGDTGDTGAAATVADTGLPVDCAEEAVVGSLCEDHFGASMGAAGDVNGDGYGDIVVGAPVTDVDPAGVAYVFYGGPGIDADEDGVLAADDCDDHDPAVGVGDELHLDEDGDGYGQADPVTGCPGQPGWSADATDCDDARPDVHPGAVEVCDDLDQDCDLAVDEELDCATTTGDDDDDDGVPKHDGGCRGGCSASGTPTWGAALLGAALVRRRRAPRVGRARPG